MKVVNVIEEIHQGGFGIIHKVEMEDGSIMARKTFNPVASNNLSEETLNKLKRRFSREVKIQEKLDEDLFIPIVYSCLETDEPWFIMPLASSSFIDEIRKCKAARKVPEGLADILNSLEHLHSLGYVHRDLKPGNILFHDDRWKLADLGLITSDETITSTFQTSDNFYAGSRDYMAPEQVTNFSGVTHHADIYSFGAILHDIFVGTPRVPFTQLVGTGIIGGIISKCTDEKTYKRYQDVGVIRDVLLSQLSKNQVSTTVSEDVSKWQGKIKNYTEWTVDDLDSFLIFIRTGEETIDALFLEITSGLIEFFTLLDKGLWKQFVLAYFDWISNKNFDFGYCDVVVGHIRNAYGLTEDLEVKAKAALIAAELGRSHNRWYVMQQVVNMCSNKISATLANRLSIEVHVEGDRARQNFKRCVERISRDLDVYHPDLVKAIKNI